MATDPQKPYELKRANLYTGLVVEYETWTDGGPFLRIRGHDTDGKIETPNTSDLYVLRDILCRIVPRHRQFRIWLWRKLTLRNWRAKRRLGLYVKGAKAVTRVIYKDGPSPE